MKSQDKEYTEHVIFNSATGLKMRLASGGVVRRTLRVSGRGVLKAKFCFLLPTCWRRKAGLMTTVDARTVVMVVRGSLNGGRHQILSFPLAETLILELVFPVNGTLVTILCTGIT